MMERLRKKNTEKEKVVHVLTELSRFMKNLLYKQGKPTTNDEAMVDMGINIINQVSNVVDLSVTELKTADLQTLWGTLEKFEKLTGLELAMAGQSSITLQHCGKELMGKLERLRMKAKFFSIGSSSAQSQSGLENLGAFRGLIDLTLTSETIIEFINVIPCIPTLECLKLDGDGEKKNSRCQIKLERFVKLRKLVIGNMKVVETVQIGCAVIKNIDTLELYKMPKLSKVFYSKEKEEHYLLEKSAKKWADTEMLTETIFLRRFKHFPSEIRKDLMIYHYDKDEKCYKYIVV